MTTYTRTTQATLFGLFAVGCLVFLEPSANATHRPPAESVCFPLHGAISVTLDSTACTSPVGLCTTGTFRSPFVSGTTRFRASGLGGGPVGETSIVTPPAVPPTTWTYAGTLSITTRIGTITFDDVGVLDNVAGTFTELNRPSSGTGTFEGATGNVYISGTVTGGGTGFDGQLTGRLCVPTD